MRQPKSAYGDLFTSNLVETLHQFEEADNFGSLIRPTVTDVSGMLDILRAKDAGGNLFLYQTHEKVLRVLKQADYLSPKYHLAIANPPYMGNKGLNDKLKVFLQDNYKDVKSDLFSAFIARIAEMVNKGGLIGMMTPFTWMFLSSYENLRSYILNTSTITSLVRPEYHAFFESAYVPICAFTIFCQNLPNYRGSFIDLQNFYGAELQPIKALEAIKNPDCGWFYRASAADFKKIPGAAIAYWLSKKILEIFATSNRLETIASPKAGLATGDNTIYQRLWTEVAFDNIAFNCQSNSESLIRHEKWYPCNSGGNFRKWFGNNEIIVNWHKNGRELRNFKDQNGKLRSRPQNINFFFKPRITWTKLSSSIFAARFREPCFIFDYTGRSAFPDNTDDILPILGFLSSKLSNLFLTILNPSISFTSGDIARLPVAHSMKIFQKKLIFIVNRIISLRHRVKIN